MIKQSWKVVIDATGRGSRGWEQNKLSSRSIEQMPQVGLVVAIAISIGSDCDFCWASLKVYEVLI